MLERATMRPIVDRLQNSLGFVAYWRLVAGAPQLWLNQRLAPAAEALPRCEVKEGEFRQHLERAIAFRPLLKRCFASLATQDGRIRSDLRQIEMQDDAAVFVKADHELPIAGSIKARGGFHEVLCHAQSIGEGHGLISPGGALEALATDEARRIFGSHILIVGSTGNLGFSIGLAGRALGFRVEVHMSAQAREWKKRRLRAVGVDVVEHDRDYTAAVAAARESASTTENGYFIDDEASRLLLLGYSSAAVELQEQLAAAHRVVDARRPLFVYLPCGVGGAPAGITLGLKVLFGDAVHCFYVEPTRSPCMLVQLAAGLGRPSSVYDVGLDNGTVADGLAVATASQLAAAVSSELISGIMTVSDEQMLQWLADAGGRFSLRLEPAAAASFAGPDVLRLASEGKSYLAQHAPHAVFRDATHVVWATGGSLLPDAEYDAYRVEGQKHAALRINGKQGPLAGTRDER